MQELLGLEVLWDGLVVSGDNFVNLLFPTRLSVFPMLDGVEELLEGGLNYGEEMVGNLEQKTGVTRAIYGMRVQGTIGGRTWSFFFKAPPTMRNA